jgi:hypothetical protein
MRLNHGVTWWATLVVVLTLLSRPAGALCSAQDLDVWPQPGRIPVNTMFVVEGYGIDQSLVETVAPCELMLVSESERLCLNPDRQ